MIIEKPEKAFIIKNMHSVDKYIQTTNTRKHTHATIQTDGYGSDTLKKRPLQTIKKTDVLKIIDRTPFYRIGIFTFLHTLFVHFLFSLSLILFISLSLSHA